MGKLVVTLSEEDVVELQAILMDGDQAGALAFLESRLAPGVREKGGGPEHATYHAPYRLKRDKKD